MQEISLKGASCNSSAAFDDRQATFAWVKDMLEAPYPGKSLVFCHAHVYCFRSNDNLPGGYKHTILIRNPYRVFPSWKKALYKVQPDLAKNPFSNVPAPFMAEKYGYSELLDFALHVKEDLKEPVIIIDADDLQANPKSILSQYFHHLGLEFKECILQWEEGDRIMSTWIASKAFLQENKKEEGGFYDAAMKSTGFQPPGEMPTREMIDPDLLPMIDFSMPFYKKLYSMRIRP